MNEELAAILAKYDVYEVLQFIYTALDSRNSVSLAEALCSLGEAMSYLKTVEAEMLWSNRDTAQPIIPVLPEA